MYGEPSLLLYSLKKGGAHGSIPDKPGQTSLRSGAALDATDRPSAPHVPKNGLSYPHREGKETPILPSLSSRSLCPAHRGVVPPVPFSAGGPDPGSSQGLW